MDTYERLRRILYSRAGKRKLELEGLKTRQILCWGMGRHTSSKPGRTFIGFGRPDGRKSSFYHVVYRLNYRKAQLRRTTRSES